VVDRGKQLGHGTKEHAEGHNQEEFFAKAEKNFDKSR
jgi:hypothetical protein